MPAPSCDARPGCRALTHENGRKRRRRGLGPFSKPGKAGRRCCQRQSAERLQGFAGLARGNGNARPPSELPSPAPQYPISTQGSQRVQGPRPKVRYEYGRLLIIRARINAYGRGPTGLRCRAAVPTRPHQCRLPVRPWPSLILALHAFPVHNYVPLLQRRRGLARNRSLPPPPPPPPANLTASPQRTPPRPRPEPQEPRPKRRMPLVTL